MVPSRKPDIVVGIDIGQTCSGVAYSIGPDWSDPHTINRWPSRHGTEKADKVATRVGYGKLRDDLRNWGFESEFADENVNVREQFKLTLDSEYEDDRQFTCHDARRWYFDYLCCLHREIEKFFDSSIPRWRSLNVEYSFSTPTTWRNPAMIASIEKLIKSAGFGSTEQQTVRMSLTEAEAAAIEASTIRYRVGDVFLICDAGGGTTDVNLLKVKATDRKIELEPLDYVEGIPIGSTLIDFQMARHIVQRLQLIQHHLQGDLYCLAEDMLMGRFQTVKHSFPHPIVDQFSLDVAGLAGTHTFPEAGIYDSRMIISRETLTEIFDQQMEQIISLMDNRLLALQKELPKEQVSFIILSGGLGSSPYLHEQLKRRYEMNFGFRSNNTASVRIMQVLEPQLAVVRGLVRERTQQLGASQEAGQEVFKSRRCRNSYGVAIRSLYDESKHAGMPFVTNPLDGRRWIENVVDWFIKQGQEIEVDNGVLRSYGATLSEAEHNQPRHARIVMSSSPPDKLPYLTTDPGCQDIVTVNYTLTQNDMKLKNRQLWKLRKKYWRADFSFVVKLGPADIKFQIVGRNGVLSSDHDTLEVEYMDPSDSKPLPRTPVKHALRPPDLSMLIDNFSTELSMLIDNLSTELSSGFDGALAGRKSVERALDEAVLWFARQLELLAKTGIEARAATAILQQRSRFVKNIQTKIAYLPQVREKGNVYTSRDASSSYVDRNLVKRRGSGTDISSVRKFIKTSFALEWLTERIKVISKLDCVMNTTGVSLLNRMSGTDGVMRNIRFTLRWNPVAFLEEQYERGATQKLERVITLTELSGNIQAVTCGQYMEQTWPMTGRQTLTALQKAIDSGITNEQTYEFPKGWFEFHLVDDRLTVSVTTLALIASEVYEQFCWLGAACRASTSQLRRSYWIPHVEDIQHLVIDFLEHEPTVTAPVNESECWIEMFRNPGIAQGFPVMRRSDKNQKGLEIPLNIMADLGGAERVVSFNGQLVLKGFSVLFVPLYKLASSITWHVYCNTDRVPYTKAFDRSLFPIRAAIDTADLQEMRHFVGWVPSATVQIGTGALLYSQIKDPRCPVVGPGCALNGITVSGGKFITGGASFTKGQKDIPIHIHSDGPYKQTVHSLQSKYVVLFDEQEHRGWLVDGATAILYLLRAQLETEPYANNGHLKIEKFELTQDVTRGAYDTLVANQYLIVDEDEIMSREIEWTDADSPQRKDKTISKIWTVEHLVRNLAHYLEQIQDHQDQVKPVYLHGTTREKLEGWSAKALIQARSSLKPRLVRLSNSGRGWVDFTRSIGAVTLIGRGFGDLIVPSTACTPCSYWEQVPSGKDYLVATIRTLQRICDEYGNKDETPLRLADKTYWHQAHELFEPCTCDGAKPQCDRVQVLLPKLHFGKVIRPDQFTEERYAQGAVIFGRSERFRLYWGERSDPTLGDGRSDEEDSGVGSSVSTSNG